MKSLPLPSHVALRIFGAAIASHAVATLAALAMLTVVVPMDLDGLVRELRLVAWIGAIAFVSQSVASVRAFLLGSRLRDAIALRREDAGASAPRTSLVRTAYVLAARTGAITLVLTVVAASLDALRIVPVSSLEGGARIASGLVAIASFQAAAHFMTIRIRSAMGEWLSVLPPEDVAIESPQRFTWRLASRIASAALIPVLGLAALMLGRPGTSESAPALAAWLALGSIVVMGIALAAAIQIGRIAETDVRKVTNHVDLLLAGGAIDAVTVEGWGERSMTTRVSNELVEAVHVLAARYVKLARDEERARRAVEEAHLLRTRFMAYMSHDLRSPLNSITGFAEVLAMESEGTLNEGQRESVLAIRESGQDLVRLVTTIVDSARLEAGRLTIFPAWTPPDAIAEEAVTRAVRGIRSPSTTIRLERGPVLPAVLVDGERIVQALLSILLHLLRDGEEDPGEIRVRIHFVPEGPERVRSVLFDVHGRARLDLEQYARILDGFRRVEAPGGRRIGGMGLGLALSHSLVLVQGGTMWCEAGERGETRFRIALPADVRPSLTEGSAPY